MTKMVPNLPLGFSDSVEYWFENFCFAEKVNDRVEMEWQNAFLHWDTAVAAPLRATADISVRGNLLETRVKTVLFLKGEDSLHSSATFLHAC